MNIAEFVAPEAGRIVRSQAGIDTFVPSPQPPTLDYGHELVMALSRADTKLSELSGIGRQLPNAHLLISPYLRREAVLSSRIEGTRASLSDVLLDDIDEPSAASQSDRQEIRNYVAAMEVGIETLRRRPVLSLNLVRDIHARLMRDIPGERGHNAAPGRFRTVQNWIGGRNSTPGTAHFVPPPPELILECLTDWERFTNTPSLFPDLIHCAIMHERFETIHPFNDGNGRVGRLLITLFLIERDRLTQPLLYLSDFIEAHRQTYYALLQRARTHGDVTGWIMFFLDGVATTAQQAITQSAALMDLREVFRARLLRKTKALELVDALFINPFMTAGRARTILAVSDPTARNAIANLIGEGILTNTSDRAWRRVYVSTPILNILEGRV